LTKLVGYQQPTCLVSVSGWNSLMEPFRFHVNYFHFRAAVFAHVGRGADTIVYGKWCFVSYV